MCRPQNFFMLLNPWKFTSSDILTSIKYKERLKLNVSNLFNDTPHGSIFSKFASLNINIIYGNRISWRPWIFDPNVNCLLWSLLLTQLINRCWKEKLLLNCQSSYQKLQSDTTVHPISCDSSRMRRTRQCPFSVLENLPPKSTCRVPIFSSSQYHAQANTAQSRYHVNKIEKTSHRSSMIVFKKLIAVCLSTTKTMRFFLTG